MRQFSTSACNIVATARSLSMPRRAIGTRHHRRHLGTATPPRLFPMKAGTPLTDLAIFKGKDAPVTLERSEYPDWVNDLVKPKLSLAALRKIKNEDAEIDQIKRYLKLTRRQAVRERNEESAS